MGDIQKKYLKKLESEFMMGVEGDDVETIKKRILDSEQRLFEIEAALDKDQDLVDAKEKVKHLASTYKDPKGLETAKIKFCLHILENRGVNL